MTCDACGEKPKKMDKGFPKAVVEINNPESLVLLRKVVVPASMGDETAFPPAIGKYFNVLLHYDASGNNYLYSSDGIPTEIGANVPSEVINRIKTLEDGYDDLSEDYEQLQSQVGDVSEALSAETSARENSDANLQGQIDALTVSSGVIDVLGTYQDLQNYDTTHVKEDDIIKVLQDSTHSNAMSYYKWVITSNVGAWVYVGSEGPYYTKSEADALLDSKQNVIADLPQIRSGAEAGATAVQPEDLARIATTGSYNDSLDKPSINNVTLTGNKSLDALGIQPKGNYALESEIPDVSNFITNTVDNLVNYYKKSETFTKQEVNDLISAITTMDIQVVQTLPIQDISTTTIYLVPKTTAETNDAYDEYIYVSNAWEHIGSTNIDLSGYQTKIDSSHKLSSDLVDDTNQTNKFVTTSEKQTWNNKYDKPNSGIPKTDLASAVQTSLGKADTALQSISSSDVTSALGYTPYNSTNPNGYTSNVGTITGITMNGASKGTSGVVDLGTVITSHQDISGKVNTSQVKNTMSTTAGDVYDVRYINNMIGDVETILTRLTTGSGV